MAGASGDDFSVMVLASDLGIDARSLLSPSERLVAAAADGNAASPEVWNDCLPHLSDAGEDDFHDLEALQVLRVQGSDKSGNRILRIVGKYFPGTGRFNHKAWRSILALSMAFSRRNRR